MMSLEQPINDELAGQARFDLRAHHELAVHRAGAKAGWDDKRESLGVDQFTTVPMAAPVRSREINIDERHRILASTASHDGPVGLIVGALVASSVLAWIATNGLAWPLAGGLSGHRVLDLNGTSSNLPKQSLNSSARTPNSLLDPNPVSWRLPEQNLNSWASVPDSNKEDRLATLIREIEREVPAEAPHKAARPANKYSTAAQQRTTSIGAREGDLQTRVKLTPTPETRPTTIEGWTLREVINGTVVLEGPNGIWRGKSGDTVPGVGRVVSIFRWGKHSIVATSRGLISTP